MTPEWCLWGRSLDSLDSIVDFEDVSAVRKLAAIPTDWDISLQSG